MPRSARLVRSSPACSWPRRPRSSSVSWPSRVVAWDSFARLLALLLQGGHRLLEALLLLLDVGHATDEQLPLPGQRVDGLRLLVAQGDEEPVGGQEAVRGVVEEEGQGRQVAGLVGVDGDPAQVDLGVVHRLLLLGDLLLGGGDLHLQGRDLLSGAVVLLGRRLGLVASPSAATCWRTWSRFGAARPPRRAATRHPRRARRSRAEPTDGGGRCVDRAGTLVLAPFVAPAPMRPGDVGDDTL